MKNFERNVILVVMVAFLVYASVVGWSSHLSIVATSLIILTGFIKYLQANVEKTELQDKISKLEQAFNLNIRNIGSALEAMDKKHNDLKNDVTKFTIQEVKKPGVSSGFKF